MKRLPQRHSLAVQTADYLREAIYAGEWKAHLPGSHELCDRLQVSLYTLYMARDILKKEGLIRVAQGRRTRILRLVRPKPSNRKNSGQVIALTSSRLEHMSGLSHYTITKLMQSLQAAGLDLSMHADPRFVWQHPADRLEQLVAEHPSACWILFSVNEAVQRWFMERELKTVISGSRHPGIRLPAVALDYESIGRDAARRFLELGHRNVAYLAFRSEREGDRATERGFREEFGKASGGSEARLLYHDRSRSGFVHALDAALHATEPSSALFVASPDYALATAQVLLCRGLIPGTHMALLARDLLPLLTHTFPQMGGYRCDHASGGRKLAQCIIDLARTGTLTPHEIWIPWQFVKGQSLGPPQKKRAAGRTLV